MDSGMRVSGLTLAYTITLQSSRIELPPEKTRDVLLACSLDQHCAVQSSIAGPAENMAQAGHMCGVSGWR